MELDGIRSTIGILIFYCEALMSASSKYSPDFLFPQNSDHSFIMFSLQMEVGPSPTVKLQVNLQQ